MNGRYVLSMVMPFVAASVVAAAPVLFTENWEDDAQGIPGSPWFVDSLMPDGGLLVAVGSQYNFPYSEGTHGLLVNYLGFIGKHLGIQAKLVPDGQEVEATDAKPLTVAYCVMGVYAPHSEWILEISLGGVHAPRLADVGENNPLPSPIPVIAYCKPYLTYEQGPKYTHYFDGSMWRTFGATGNNEWHSPYFRLSTNSVYLHCACTFGEVDLPRQYLGNFDRISIYTLDCNYSESTVVDDISITGGDVVHTLSISPDELFVSIGPVGGAFVPECKTYTLTNITSLPMDWSATKVQDWLTVSPDSGTLVGEASIEVNVCVNANANTLPLDLHTDTVIFTDVTHAISQTRNVELYVGQIDSFTEELAGSNDLDNLSVMLTPDGLPHLYRACTVTANQFPTPPAGGSNLALSGDNSVMVALLQGAQVSLYGTAYSEFYVGSNGYITFGEGDTLATGLTLDHFKKPRISGLFADLAPQAGQVSYKQLMDRVAVTYQNVVRVGTSDANSFQIEMFYDGRIRLTWLDVATAYGVVGLSKGLGIPTNFHFSDFSAYAACPPAGYSADFDDDGDVDQSDFGHLQTCLAALPGFILVPACADTDVDLDGVVGSADILAFSLCFGGPNVTPPSSCLEFGTSP